MPCSATCQSARRNRFEIRDFPGRAAAGHSVPPRWSGGSPCSLNVDLRRLGEFLSPRACEGQLPRCAKRRSHNDPTAGNGMRCARRGRGRFVQTTENPAGSPGAARGRVLLCKLIVKTCPTHPATLSHPDRRALLVLFAAQQMEHGAGSPGAARSRVLLRKY